MKDIRFIADIGSNHNQDLNRAKKLIEEAARIGCWGVKFQLFKAETLYAPGFADVDELKKRELPNDWHNELIKCARENNIEIGITPFEMVVCGNDIIFDENVYKYDFIKISSFDFDRILDKKILTNGKKVIASCGLTELDDFTVQDIYRNVDCLMHCVSKYPTKKEEAGLFRIGDIINKFPMFEGGYSDHTRNVSVILDAMDYLRTGTIEFHLDLKDGKGYEYKYGHCWKPDKIKKCIDRRFLHFARITRSELKKKYRFQITQEQINQKADICDGMRPLKSARNNLAK